MVQPAAFSSSLRPRVDLSSHNGITSTAARIKGMQANELRLGISTPARLGHCRTMFRNAFMLHSRRHTISWSQAVESHTVREFCELAFQELGLDTVMSSALMKRFLPTAGVEALIGDAPPCAKRFWFEANYTLSELYS